VYREKGSVGVIPVVNKCERIVWVCFKEKRNDGSKSDKRNEGGN